MEWFPVAQNTAKPGRCIRFASRQVQFREEKASVLLCPPMQTIPKALAHALYVPGLIFEALVRVRNALYSARTLSIRRLPAPVISIGNLTMGGAGKTPLVICLGRMLADMGYVPAVLTRGYRRAQPRESWVVPPGKTVPSPHLVLGDEPALIRRHLSSAWMGVSKDRYAAGMEIARKASGIVFVLDDGFQHRALHRDLDIVIIDPLQPLIANRVFPAGTLREPLSALSRCDVVMISGDPNTGETDAVAKKIRSIVNARLFYCRQKIRQLLPFQHWRAGEGAFDGDKEAGPAFLVSAIGNPERFRRDVMQTGIEVRGARFFPDHHRLTREDWRACSLEAGKSGASAIIVTEKDAVKIDDPPDTPLYVAVQSVEIPDGRKLENLLRERVGREQ